MRRARAASIPLSSRTDFRAALALAAVFAVACQGTPRPAVTPDPPALAATVQLHRDIDAILAAPVLARTTWGILIRSADRGDTLYTLNAGKLLMPGSTMKIVTLAAAADRLGWDYVYETSIVAAGALDANGGVLDGDLLVVGTGDPSVDAVSTGPAIFAGWAAALKGHGIRAITGRVLGDDNRFDDEEVGPGWAWDDLPGRDAPAVSALQFNENVVLATIVSGPAVGAAATVSLEPPGSHLVPDVRLTTTAPGTPPAIGARRSAGSNRLELRGSVPMGGGPYLRAVSVANPTLFFATALRDALTVAGIEVRGPAADIDDVANPPRIGTGTVIATHRSPPLSQLAFRLMKNSVNLYGETLFKTLGASGGEPSFENGRMVAGATVRPWGVDGAAVVQVDGSGLSRYNYVTAEALVTILTHVNRNDRLRGAFEASLPIAGVDGTLAARMKTTAAEGNARAKSGTLANVRTLAGYVSGRDGETLVFAIMANNFGTMPETAIAAIDAIVVKLAEFAR